MSAPLHIGRNCPCTVGQIDIRWRAELEHALAFLS